MFEYSQCRAVRSLGSAGGNPRNGQRMSEGLHPGVVRVQDALLAAGAKGSVRMLAESARTAAEAAAALGVEVGQITNSLIFVADGEPLLVLTSGRHRVDTAKVAELVGVAKVSRADADFVREHAGVAIGGVSPIGHPRPLRTLVDVALKDYDVVWAAAGHTHAVFPTTFDELLTLTGGTPATVGD
jgi:prolyl-tRNA editing enzyme YbaK/EbsC (Cys-tRNA(Pro) deacylase)